MLIIMSLDAPRDDIDRVKSIITERKCTPHEIPGSMKLAIGITGPTNTLVEEDFRLLPSVQEVVRVSKKYKLVSRMMKSEDTVVKFEDAEIGGKNLAIIAGPCSVENRDQIFKSAEVLCELNIPFMRAGAFKPRSSPYAFQGLKEKGLELLMEVKREFGLKIVTEALSQITLPAVAETADIIQIGARNMQNYALLEEAGKTQKPILLKRGMSATVEDLLLSAEYILAQDNFNVILCERGIRTFETASRNTLDLNAVPIIKSQSHLPIIVDPSHGIGIGDKVGSMSLASIAAGADGVMVEMHPNPREALSDGFQSISPEELGKLKNKISDLAPIVNRKTS